MIDPQFIEGIGDNGLSHITRQPTQNIINTNTCAFDTGFSKPNFSINANSFLPLLHSF